MAQSRQVWRKKSGGRVKTLKVRHGLALLGLLLASACALGCDEISAGTSFWVRLTSPVSSFTAHPGDHLSAILTEEVECGGVVAFPAGSRLDGSVRKVHKVGWGFRHETAEMEIAFTDVTSASGTVVNIQTVVAEVENARERVQNGVIHGIRSTDTPQGRINSRLRHLPAWNPYSDVGLIAFKVGFPVFPEPEIYFRPGTDLRLVLAVSLPSPPVASDAVKIPGFREEEIPDLVRVVASLSERSTTTDLAEADITNLVFLGSRAQVVAAFRAAGWSPSDAFSLHSFLHTFYAFLHASNYPQAPMRPLLIGGAPADMNWERSLNSYAKRDHLRLWQTKENCGDNLVWLGTATRDTGATLSVRYHRFLHHIAADLDAERSKVLRDLTIAGCVSRMDYLSRPGSLHITKNATGDPMYTDGAVAVVQLQDCQPTTTAATKMIATDFRAGNRAFRFARRQILTFRSDIWRANIIYGVYDLGRMTVETLHPKQQPPVEVANTMLTNPRRLIAAVGETQDAKQKEEAEQRPRTGDETTSSGLRQALKPSPEADGHTWP